ncbi:MAG TPA: TonB-dependent receptor [Verrucomicrobiae bacterium]|nr:TonB-dependent receptor [Verrucomicrobiae bacterium]
MERAWRTCSLHAGRVLRWFGYVLVLGWIFSAHAAEDVSPDLAAASEAQSVAAYKGMSLEELMNQDVTSVSRQPEPYREAPASIQVVTHDDIVDFGAASIPEALRLADNLDVAQASSSTWHISARGFNSSVGNKLLVLVDGRSIYTPLFSGVIWNQQDYLMEDLDRIEVISGPGGTLWGENAVNGVINIVTKDAKETQGLYTEVGGGTWLQDFVGLRYGGMISSNTYFRVYGKYFDRGPEEYRDGSSAHDGWNRGQAGFRVDADAAAGNPLTVEGEGFGGFSDVMPGGEGTPKATGTTSGGHILGRWTHTFAEDSDFNLQMYYDRTDLEAPFQGLGAIPPGPLGDALDTYDLDFQDRFGLGTRQRITWGAEYRFTHDVVSQAPLVAFLPAVLDQNLFSAFLQDEIKLYRELYLTLGSKIEHNDYTGLEYEPSARLQLNLTEHQTLWGAVSRAIRAPSRYDRDLYEPNPAYSLLLVGNDTFRSEDVIAYELGYRAQLAKRVSGSIAGFFNQYDHLRTLNLRNSTTLPAIFENNLRGYTYGTEISLTYQALDWWRLHAGYDLLEEHLRTGPGGDLQGGLAETADPKHQVFLRSSMDLPGRVSLNAALRWIDTIQNNSGAVVGRVPAYAELDLRLAWQATKNVEFSIVGQNLLHEQHLESGFPDSTQEQIVRCVYGAIKFRW